MFLFPILPLYDVPLRFFSQPPFFHRDKLEINIIYSRSGKESDTGGTRHHFQLHLSYNSKTSTVSQTIIKVILTRTPKNTWHNTCKITREDGKKWSMSGGSFVTRLTEQDVRRERGLDSAWEALRKFSGCWRHLPLVLFQSVKEKRKTHPTPALDLDSSFWWTCCYRNSVIFMKWNEKIPGHPFFILFFSAVECIPKVRKALKCSKWKTGKQWIRWSHWRCKKREIFKNIMKPNFRTWWACHCSNLEMQISLLCLRNGSGDGKLRIINTEWATLTDPESAEQK